MELTTGYNTIMVIEKNAPLAKYTSLHAGGNGQIVIHTEPGEDLKSIVLDAATKGSVWVLGYGANCLISDAGLPGTVIFNQTESIQKTSQTRLRVNSGTNWDSLVQYAIQNSLWGMEFTSGIPGGVGAAIAGNIAAYGHKVADILVEATILRVSDGSITTWHNQDFKFTYRGSALQSKDNQDLVVLDAIFELSAQSTGELEYDSALAVAKELGLKPDSLASRRKIIMETRRQAGALLGDTSSGPWTAGSFFKNPLVDESQIQNILSHEEKAISREQLLRQNQIHSLSKSRVSAAHVLLAAGFHRGQTWGQVRLHPDHILKIENIDNATAQDIYNVVQEIRQTVKDKLGIELEPEVQILGEF